MGNDLISKKSLIESLMDLAEIKFDDVLRCIESLPNKANNMDNNWIPCKEKLPENDERYKGKKVINCLVTTDNGTVTKVQRYYNEYAGTNWWWGRGMNVIAWQPLPKGYKKNGGR